MGQRNPRRPCDLRIGVNVRNFACILKVYPKLPVELRISAVITYEFSPSEDTISREFGAYDSIRDNFPKYVVSLDEFDMSRNGIKHRNIRDFLLAEEWN